MWRRGRPVSYDVDDGGVHRLEHGRLVESLAWSQLAQVSVHRDREAVAILLRGADGHGVTVAHEAALQIGLLDRLSKLAGFDTLAVCDALGGSRSGVFECWSAPAGGA